LDVTRAATEMGIRGNRTAVEICLLCTNFFGALSGGVLGLTITPIAHDFGVDIELAAWTTLSSMFASAMLGPALGKFADSFGRRRLFWVMYFLQLVSYFTCWQAPTFGWLVVGRVLGGMSWAGTSPAGFGIMTRGLDPQRRGRIVALQSATGSLGGSIGYALGGLVVQHVGWRYLFSVPLPVLCCIWLASLLLLPPDDAADSPASSTQRKDSSGSGGGQQRGETAYEKLAQFDVAGSVVFAIFLGFLLLGVNRGNAQGWTSTPILTYFAVAAG
jgi:MFS family permease